MSLNLGADLFITCLRLHVTGIKEVILSRKHLKPLFTDSCLYGGINFTSRLVHFLTYGIQVTDHGEKNKQKIKTKLQILKKTVRKRKKYKERKREERDR